ncbi:MAG: hypothetical protein JW811_03665 [Clostridiales bacterium]|nr:hypothetical protein [Clostridiales bacterium]
MKHKSIILFVCLVLTVFGITSATAESLETVTTISLQTGTLLADYEEVSQILDTAAIRIHSMPDGYGAFVLSLNGTDALKSLLKAEQDGVYVQCNALGQQPLYFTYEDIKNFIMEQLEAYAETQPADMPFDTGMMQSMMDGSLTDEQIFEMMGIDEELIAYISDIQAKQVVEKGTFALEGSDIADTKTVVALSKEDISRAMDLPIVREQISGQMLMTGTEYSQEEIDQMIDEQLAEVKQMIEDSNITVTSTAYTMGDEFIAYEFDLTAETDDYSGGSVPMNISVTVTKTSIGSAAFYQMSVMLTEGSDEFLNQYGSLYIDDTFISGQYVFYGEPDEPMFEAALNCDRSQADHSFGELALTLYDGGAQTVYVTFDQQKADNVTDTAINVYLGGSADAIKKALAETSLITVNLHTVVQPDSGFFAALQNATPETSVQLLQLNEEELDAYMQSMEQGLMMTLLTVIDNLPPEISESLMQEMGGF